MSWRRHSQTPNRSSADRKFVQASGRHTTPNCHFEGPAPQLHDRPTNDLATTHPIIPPSSTELICQNVFQARVRIPLPPQSPCATAKPRICLLTLFRSRGATGNKLKMTLGLPVYVHLVIPRAFTNRFSWRDMDFERGGLSHWRILEIRI